jgi:hypothetical protein
MDAKEIRTDVKNEWQKQADKLDMLRDEVKLHLHLATLDAKKEWDERLEPKILEAQTAAMQASETSRTALRELVTRVESFVAKLKEGRHTHS